jgi:hypothetical protein
MQPLVIVSDVHLGHRGCRPAGCALARLVTQHRGCEIVLNGDTFNLACDPWDRDPAGSAVAMLDTQPCLRRALAGHLAGGDPLTIVAGNHDLAVHRPGFREAVLALLTPGADGDLRVEPWIVRRGRVHIEHGHVYDPANSPTHPLAQPSFRTEPVGIALTRRFVGPYDAWELLAEQWTATTTDSLKVMFDRFGARAPLAVGHYLALLVAINAEIAVTPRLERERRAGDAALAEYAVRVGVPETRLRALIAGRQRPLHFSFADTFRRFGFDAALALIAVPAGVLAAALTGGLAPLGASATGLAYLLAQHKRIADRAANHMPDALRNGAALVRCVTDAELVVFGHSHREEDADGYLNLGAFGDPPRDTRHTRSYVRVDEHGRAERRRLE